MVQVNPLQQSVMAYGIVPIAATRDGPELSSWAAIPVLQKYKQLAI